MKKSTAPITERRPKVVKRAKTGAKKDYPDADPEWEHLEERYSQINSDMKKLASMLGGGGADNSPDGEAA